MTRITALVARSVMALVACIVATIATSAAFNVYLPPPPPYAANHTVAVMMYVIAIFGVGFAAARLAWRGL